MITLQGACAPDDNPPECGEPGNRCGICIGRPNGCHVSADGVQWCAGVRGHVPGYRVVGQRDGLTGYRRREADEPIDPAAAARVEAFLAEHAARCLAEREDKARCAAVVEAGLAGMPPGRLKSLLSAAVADAVATSPVIADAGRDLDELARAVVELRAEVRRGAH